jgi:hypothetical protein
LLTDSNWPRSVARRKQRGSPNIDHWPVPKGFIRTRHPKREVWSESGQEGWTGPSRLPNSSGRRRVTRTCFSRPSDHGRSGCSRAVLPNAARNWINRSFALPSTGGSFSRIFQRISVGSDNLVAGRARSHPDRQQRAFFRFLPGTYLTFSISGNFISLVCACPPFLPDRSGIFNKFSLT